MNFINLKGKQSWRNSTLHTLMKVLIAEDHKVVIKGTIQMLNETVDGAEACGVMDMAELMEALNRESYDLVILDINIPGGNKPTMIEKIRLVQPQIKILIFSGYDEAIYAYPYLQAGANGYLSKNSTETDFKLAIESVMNNAKYLSAAMQQQSIERLIGTGQSSEGGLKMLSARETEVLNLLIKGDTTAQIGKALDMKISTVSTHKIKIFKKLHVANLVELIEYMRMN